MSNLVVEVCQIDSILPHSNADSLELAQIKGWQCVIRKGEYRAGDKVVYFPMDTLLPDEQLSRFGVSQYVSKNRIRCAKLRGEPSFGLVVGLDNPDWEVGLDVAEHYGATKYEPPVKPFHGGGMGGVGGGLPEVLGFPKYTEIDNLRHYPDLFTPGELVVVTEKVHGTNSRVGIVGGELLVGSRKLRRQVPEGWVIGGQMDINSDGCEIGQDSPNRVDYKSEIYWFPLTVPSVVRLLEYGRELFLTDQIVLYGEIYGRGVQKLHYGESGLAYRAFDLAIDGRYVATPEFYAICRTVGVPVVPVARIMRYSLEAVRLSSTGPSLVYPGHIREGVVVRPMAERLNPKTGRTILKYLNDEYLLSRKEDNTDV